MLKFMTWLEAIVSTSDIPNQIYQSLKILIPAGTWDRYHENKETNMYIQENLEMGFTAYAVVEDHDKFNLQVKCHIYKFDPKLPPSEIKKKYNDLSLFKADKWDHKGTYDSVKGSPLVKFEVSLMGWKPGMKRLYPQSTNLRVLKEIASDNELKTPYEIAKWTKEKIGWFYRDDNEDKDPRSSPKPPVNYRSPVLV